MIRARCDFPNFLKGKAISANAAPTGGDGMMWPLNGGCIGKRIAIDVLRTGSLSNFEGAARAAGRLSIARRYLPRRLTSTPAAR